MQDMLGDMGVSNYMQGSGGIEIIGQSSGSKFYIDTASLDPALVNFTINLDATATLNPQITDGNITTKMSPISTSQSFPLPVQLKKVGSGYKFILPGMKPGGGDLEFKAVMEKTFTDPDKWDKEAAEADRRREEAERLRKELLEKIKKQMQDEYNKQQSREGDGTTESTSPVPSGDEDTDLAPLVPEDSSDTDLAPLVPEENSDTDLAPLVPEDSSDIDLAPLVPTNDETVDDFPTRKP
jgi:hypothetical protein